VALIRGRKALSFGIQTVLEICGEELAETGYRKIPNIKAPHLKMKRMRFRRKMGMTMRARKKANEFLTREDEKRLGENLRKVHVSCNPNPERKSCPDQAIIRDLAFHKKIGSPQLCEQVTVHMAGCSECTKDALRYVEEYKKQKRKKR
jgi:hypothetical protein